MKVFMALGLTPQLWFWRSNDGTEVDLLVQVGARVVPIEFKLTSTPTARHVLPLVRLRSWIGEDGTGQGLLVCRVPEPIALAHGCQAIPWRHYPDWLMKRLVEV